jgi:hypothetical protein
MSFDIYRTRDGYEVLLLPPLEPEERSLYGLTQREVWSELAARGVDQRSIADVVMIADRAFERGTTDRSRNLSAAWRRSRNGRATQEDIDLLRREASTDDTEFRRTYSVQALSRAGYEEEAVDRLLGILRKGTEDEQQLAFRFLSEWRPELFEREASRALASSWHEVTDDARGWVMASAVKLLQRGHARTLLDQLERIALDPEETPHQRLGAWALLLAAGFSPADERARELKTDVSPDEVDELARLIRERWNPTT